MKKFLLKLALISFLSTFTYSQSNFDFDFDFAQFGYDSSSNYVEFYYSFNQNNLLQNVADSATYIEGILDVSIKDSVTGDEVVTKQWKISHKYTDTDSLGRNLVGVIGFLLSKGTYECRIGGMDSINSSNNKYFTEYLRINPFVSDKISLSDVQISSKIIQDSPNKSSIFYKNSYEIIPIPTSVFGENQPVLFFYCELYNLASEERDYPLKFNTLVFNSRGQVISNKLKTISSNVNSRVEVGTVLINKFSTDTYTLMNTLVDTVSNYGVSSSKRFYVYNPSVEVKDTVTSSITASFLSQFGVMSEEELDDLFNKSKYIAMSSEIDQYDDLATEEGKREFMYKFWNARDNDPSTPRNEYFTEYMERIEICDQRFTALGKPGWKTDRGRVYLRYGEPSEIERFPNQTDTKPYEIWHYNEIEGGVIFVFADLTSFSDYQLIHSSARGELRDDSWYARIQQL
jgi:GWxTD domain-containing protein